jgi:hypothetical protein
MENKNNGLIVGGVTFVLFMAEALLHYNLGVHKDPNETRKFVIPPTKDFIKLGLIVGTASFLNAYLIGRVSK